MVIAITGGVACGKSRVSEDLKQALQAPFFSCDRCVSQLFEEPDVLEQVEALLASVVGPTESGSGKAALRKQVFENSEFRGKLEQLLHPMVEQRMNEFLAKPENRSEFALVEVPLLYEVDFPLERDIDLVVAASSTTQIERMIGIRGLKRELAQQIIGSQLPINEKIHRADWVVWNDGSVQALTLQIEHLVRRCESTIQ